MVNLSHAIVVVQSTLMQCRAAAWKWFECYYQDNNSVVLGCLTALKDGVEPKER